MDDFFTDMVDKASRGADLTRGEARQAFEHIMTGTVPEKAIGDLLMALRTKGESVAEIVGAAEAMRAHSLKVRCDADCIDTCGTGGDGISTFNTSTTAAIIAAAAGATVAKHGNRSSTRTCGSTEVLAQLGIDVEADRSVVERSLREHRIGYLNAGLLHPAMKHAAPVRQALRVRTIFNLLGPLTNPAGARRQVLGVPAPELLELIASALTELGVTHAWVVHGQDGLCDLTITAPTSIVEVRSGATNRFELSPEDAGLPRGDLDELRISSAAQSAEIVRDILAGSPGAPRNHALLNGGAALVVAGKAHDLAEGVQRAAESVDRGGALDTLNAWTMMAGMGQ